MHLREEELRKARTMVEEREGMQVQSRRKQEFLNTQNRKSSQESRKTRDTCNFPAQEEEKVSSIEIQNYLTTNLMWILGIPCCGGNRQIYMDY